MNGPGQIGVRKPSSFPDSIPGLGRRADRIEEAGTSDARVGYPRDIEIWFRGSPSVAIASRLADNISQFAWHHATRFALEVNETSSLT